MNANDFLSQLRIELPPLILRRALPQLIPGLNPRTLANEDWRGTGPKRIKIGRRVAYLRDDFLAWLEGKIEDACT